MKLQLSNTRSRSPYTAEKERTLSRHKDHFPRALTGAAGASAIGKTNALEKHVGLQRIEDLGLALACECRH